MDWKKFLEPNWTKLILFILVPWTLVTIYMLLLVMYISPASGLFYIVNPFGAIYSYILSSQGDEYFLAEFENLGFMFINSLIGLIDIAYRYFLACFIFWIFKRIRNEKISKKKK